MTPSPLSARYAWSTYCQGSPSVIEGRVALYEYLRGYPETIDVRELPTTTMYTTGDPDLVVMEWSVAGTVVRTGKPYAMRYATS